GVAEAVVGDGEDADVGRPPGLREQPGDAAGAVVVRAEQGLGGRRLDFADSHGVAARRRGGYALRDSDYRPRRPRRQPPAGAGPTPLSPLTLPRIRRQVGDDSIHKAKSYTRTHVWGGLRVQGAAVKGECQGTAAAPYRVEVVFDGDDIARADCSCP